MYNDVQRMQCIIPYNVLYPTLYVHVIHSTINLLTFYTFRIFIWGAYTSYGVIEVVQCFTLPRFKKYINLNVYIKKQHIFTCNMKECVKCVLL